MRTDIELLKERVLRYVKGKTEEAEVSKILKASGVKYENVSEEFGYPNFRIYSKDVSEGYIRAYKGRSMNSFKVQEFKSVSMVPSGIPTFEPSGRRSL